MGGLAGIREKVLHSLLPLSNFCDCSDLKSFGLIWVLSRSNSLAQLELYNFFHVISVHHDSTCPSRTEHLFIHKPHLLPDP